MSITISICQYSMSKVQTNIEVKVKVNCNTNRLNLILTNSQSFRQRNLHNILGSDEQQRYNDTVCSLTRFTTIIILMTIGIGKGPKEA